MESSLFLGDQCSLISVIHGITSPRTSKILSIHEHWPPLIRMIPTSSWIISESDVLFTFVLNYDSQLQELRGNICVFSIESGETTGSGIVSSSRLTVTLWLWMTTNRRRYSLLTKFTILTQLRNR